MNEWLKRHKVKNVEYILSVDCGRTRIEGRIFAPVLESSKDILVFNTADSHITKWAYSGSKATITLRVRHSHSTGPDLEVWSLYAAAATYAYNMTGVVHHIEIKSSSLQAMHSYYIEER
jgi:hypothetical protein